jgi:hypothetical protein
VKELPPSSSLLLSRLTSVSSIEVLEELFPELIKALSEEEKAGPPLLKLKED